MPPRTAWWEKLSDSYFYNFSLVPRFRMRQVRASIWRPRSKIHTQYKLRKIIINQKLRSVNNLFFLIKTSYIVNGVKRRSQMLISVRSIWSIFIFPRNKAIKHGNQKSYQIWQMRFLISYFLSDNSVSIAYLKNFNQFQFSQ